MNVYTCKTYLPFIPIILATLIPVLFGIYFVANFKNPFSREPGRVLLSGIVLILLGVFFLSMYVHTYIDNYRNIFLKKQNGQVEVVEGVITDFTPSDFLDNRADSFMINGVDFTIRSNSLAPGYNKIAARGGVINAEGMFVRIKYVLYNDEKHIVSIDIL